jgi:hypothetical protein
MPVGGSFKTNPVSLAELLRDCERGAIQLPDFQRSWVWDEERIKGLIASISQAFPVGALMTLETGGEVDFAPRLIQGAPPDNAKQKPTALLLDGQQRMTSLYQTALRKTVVETVTARNARVKRWYYIDIRRALDPEVAREEAIVGVPADRLIKSNFGKDIDLDLSTSEREYEAMMFPVNCVFDWDDWKDGFGDYWIAKGELEKRGFFKTFQDGVLQNFRSYDVPVIALDRDTSKEAVCLVFEKVNTGGKALDAFELVTAMYAADGFRLRDDWAAREKRMKSRPALTNISSTEFMQAISLLHTKAIRRAAEGEGRENPPAVSATRQSLLKLPLAAYQNHANIVETGFDRAARFLRLLGVYRGYDLPYQSQLTPLAAILAELGDGWENVEIRHKLMRWYWNGVFGELYGSATESRLARDIQEVPAWLAGGPEPSTIVQSTFDAQRLQSMRTRLSAAYKGVSALLMKKGANDFRSGQAYDQTVFFDEQVDIHHIFPKAWCEKAKLPPEDYDSIINKTPLGARTNRILGGVAPSEYVARLERGWEGSPAISADKLDDLLRSHLIDPGHLRTDDFAGFLKARREELLKLIEDATGKTVYRGEGSNEAETYGEDEAESETAQEMEPAE